MESLCTSTLSSLNPLSSHFKITVKVDRIFNNEHVWIVGPRRSPMKELISIDIVVFDNEGSKMLMKLMTEDSRDIFLEILKEGTAYEIFNPRVESGGENVHQHYHLILHASCCVQELNILFRNFPYTIKIPFQLERGKVDVTGFFDVVGFLLKVSPIRKVKCNSMWEKEIEIELGTWNSTFGWINKKVLCVLRGSWVEPTAKDLQDLFDLENPPFIHLRYAIMEAHLLSDVIGCLQYISPISKVKSNGFWENEMRILLSCRRNKVGGCGRVVMCVLCNSWLDSVEKVVKVTCVTDVAPFVHLRYAVSLKILSSGIPAVQLYSDAIYLDLDPPNIRLHQLKIGMFSA